MIALIWAMDENRTIGLNNRLPWHFPEDLKYFKAITQGKKVLMGRKTYESMLTYFPSGKLPYEKVYVVSKQNIILKHVTVINDIHTFLKTTSEDIYVLGGSNIYQIALTYADNLYITYILGRYDGDTKFPLYTLNAFKLKRYQIKPNLILTHYERK
jgi:dihydrofolate reductase